MDKLIAFLKRLVLRAARAAVMEVIATVSAEVSEQIETKQLMGTWTDPEVEGAYRALDLLTDKLRARF